MAAEIGFYEVLATRRSVRSYSPREVPEKIVEKVLDAARLAPSGNNRQPWRFIVVRDQSARRELAAACHNQTFVGEAPVVIVACAVDIKRNYGGYMGWGSVLVDVAIAFDHLTLAARAEGLGTCWIGAFDNVAVKKLLGIPDDVNVVAITPLGYPSSKTAFTASASRLALCEIVMRERWTAK